MTRTKKTSKISILNWMATLLKSLFSAPFIAPIKPAQRAVAEMPPHLGGTQPPPLLPLNHPKRR